MSPTDIHIIHAAATHAVRINRRGRRTRWGLRRDRHRHTSPPRRRRSRLLLPHGAWDSPGAAPGHVRLDLV